MFHVPEQYRLRTGPLASTERAGHNGAFILPPKIQDRLLLVIASDGMSWEHASVRCATRGGKSLIPTWVEMCHVKSIFWDDEDVVMQLHPAVSEYVNLHPHVLHLWRPVGLEIPTPPSILVGPITGAGPGGTRGDTTED